MSIKVQGKGIEIYDLKSVHTKLNYIFAIRRVFTNKNINFWELLQDMVIEQMKTDMARVDSVHYVDL